MKILLSFLQYCIPLFYSKKEPEMISRMVGVKSAM